MKNLILGAILLFSVMSFGQTIPTEKDRNMFLSLGLSTSQGDFKTNSYPSIELGYVHEKISYSAVFGRGDFNGVLSNSDKIQNYWFELKFSPSYSVGPLNGFLIAGGGAYFDSTEYFAELGLGLSYTYNRFTYGCSFTNWDTKNYITPFISVSL